MSTIPRTPHSRRVAVLGAGLSGLAAATRLEAAGHQVTIHEARDRVGGRVWSQQLETPLGTYTIERGAEFVLGGYDTLRALVEAHGLGLADTTMSYYVRQVAGPHPVTTDAIADAGRRAAEIAERRPADTSVESVLSELEAPEDVKAALRARVEMSSAVAADQVSASSLGAVASMTPQPSWRIAGGNQSLPLALTAALTGTLHLGDPAVEVSDAVTGTGLTVITRTGQADYDDVVVALPPSIVTDPATIRLPLTTGQRDAFRWIQQGHAAKLHLPLTRTPASSAVMSPEHRCWNWTASDASGTVAPVLNSFIGTYAAIDRLGLRHSADRWAEATRAMRPDLDLDGAEPLATVWTEDTWARGAYTALDAAATPADITPLESADARVHLAGEYTETVFTGLMEGALRSGHRAADRIIAAARLATV
ncbi:flavin monoamine oxidase family protein [Streptomyces sp. NPDC055955]|uniref:flavin monoamine oxidase family protein n=1 Tax=Streptomyces sp. NPDC055955 TaxID=3345665 RepID=UPI0035D89317